MNQLENNMKVHFFGAAGTVTGSKYLIETNDVKILIDCGLFQGLKELRLQNWQNLPVDASKIDFVVLTHGHLDHVGYLPLLVRQGFKGAIYATAPTIEISKLILSDSAKIQEEDAKRANHDKYTKHTPAKPLYSTKEAEAVFPYFKAKPISIWHELMPNVSVRFQYNGHILGATFVELKVNEKLFVFSGDIGRDNDPILRNPEKPEAADVLFIESTYGNRFHPDNMKNKLADIINESIRRNGTIIIPSFAVERTQLIMFLLWQLKNEKKIPSIPIYMDSPMGSHVLEIFENNLDWHKLTLVECYGMNQVIEVTHSYAETELLLKDKTPKIIIASSGMATGGRVLSYFEQYLGDASATILLAGYQGEGTRGRSLLDGAKEIKLRGKWFPVHATVDMIEGLSAHADQNELIDWMSKLAQKPKQVFVIHGETDASLALSEKIKEIYQVHTIIPMLNQVVEIE
jgi:metallo-beta-lactamase family protein